MFKPTDKELAEAKSLGIDGAEKMTAPALRAEIARARRRKAQAQHGPRFTPTQLRMFNKYRKLKEYCETLGSTLDMKSNTLSYEQVKAEYVRLLRKALVDAGLVDGETFDLPTGVALACGKVVVGQTSFNEAAAELTIRLRAVNEKRVRIYSAYPIWEKLVKRR